jgi:hypothetical protein
MTTPQKPSCVHLTNVTVLAPYQVVFDGTVYLPGDTATDVPVDEADRWVLNGWAEQAATKEPPAKPMKAASK